MNSLLIIIPAYNEEKNIGALLDGLTDLKVGFSFDVLVIDDASSDGTRKEAEKRGVTVISHIFNMGYGSGLQTGYKYAYSHGYSYVIQMDADGQHDICNIEPIYRALTEKDGNGAVPDIVIGSRFLPGAEEYKCGPLRRTAMKLFSGRIKRTTGVYISDPTSGLQGLSERAFGYYREYGNFDEKYPDANMIMQMLLLGVKVKEIPAVMHVRTNGVSMHSGLKPILYMFRMMFCMWAVYMRHRLWHGDKE